MKKKRTYTKVAMATIVLLLSLGLTIGVAMHQQRLDQFAQQPITNPPLFGCLQVGESNSTACGTKLGDASRLMLSMHGRPLENAIVYYNDRVSGSLSYTNTGDQPFAIQTIGIAATSSKEAGKQVLFLPQQGSQTLAQNQTYTVPKSSYLFTASNPSGLWSVGTFLKSNGQVVPVEEKPVPISVNASCTGLRVLEMTEKDKANLKALCAKTPNSKLCTSRQYCEIFKGEGCTQKNLSKPIEKAQCDRYIIVDKEEQDILEELCTKYPQTDACKDFCLRSIGAKICPPFPLTNLPKSKYAPATNQASQSASLGQAVAGMTAPIDDDITQIAAPGACVNGGAGYASCGTPPAPAQPPAPPKPAAKPASIGGKASVGAKSVVGRATAGAKGVLGKIGGAIGNVISPPKPPPPPPPPVTRENAPNRIISGQRICSHDACPNLAGNQCSPSNCQGWVEKNDGYGRDVPLPNAETPRNNEQQPVPVRPYREEDLEKRLCREVCYGEYEQNTKECNPKFLDDLFFNLCSNDDLETRNQCLTDCEPSRSI